MNVKMVLNEAVTAIAEVEVPEDFREIAFTKILDSLLRVEEARNGISEYASQQRPDSRQSELKSQSESDDIIERLARSLSVDVTTVGRVYSEVDGAPHLNLPSSRLESTKAKATKQIALLIALARQTLEFDDFTPIDEIRKIAEHFNKYDSANFAATISSMSGYFRVQGKGQSKKLKLNQPGREAATELMTRLGDAANG